MAITRREAMVGGAAMLATAAAASIEPGRTLSPRAMQADVRLLRTAYERLHPGLHRYLTPAEAGAGFERLATEAARPMSLGAFYVALSRFLHTVRCGHSYANFFNQSGAVQAALFDTPTQLPLQFLWLGTSMIVTADPFATGIAPGSEVLAIDGRPAGAILATLMRVARADGHNDAKRRRLLSVQGEDGYESCDIFHHLMIGGRERYRLDVRGPDGRRRTTVVPAITLAQRRSQQAIGDERGDQPVWTMERRGPAALLTMNGWGLYNSKWDWQGWIDEQMDRLAIDGAERLVIDIRRNEGGEDCGNAVAAHLLDRPVPLDDARRLVRFREVPAELKPFCDTWDRAFDRLGVDARPYDDRFLELVGEDRGPTMIAPKGKRFRGEVRVLVGPQNSSATFAFAQLIERERLGTLIGETTGGNRRGINGGCFYFFRLPETGLEADLPLIGTFPRVPQPDGGIVPSRVMPLTARAIADGSDPVLAAALA